MVGWKVEFEASRMRRAGAVHQCLWNTRDSEPDKSGVEAEELRSKKEMTTASTKRKTMLAGGPVETGIQVVEEEARGPRKPPAHLEGRGAIVETAASAATSSCHELPRGLRIRLLRKFSLENQEEVYIVCPTCRKKEKMIPARLATRYLQ